MRGHPAVAVPKTLILSSWECGLSSVLVASWSKQDLLEVNFKRICLVPCRLHREQDPGVPARELVSVSVSGDKAHTDFMFLHSA